MGRSLATVAGVVVAIFAIALLDRGEPQALQVPAVVSAGEGSLPSPGEGAFGGLADCVGSAGARLPADSSFLGLSKRGIAEISERVADLRERAFDGPVEATILGPAGIDRRIAELLERDGSPELARREGEVLQLLGAIPPGSDLFALTEDALASQVVGLFDPVTEELLVTRSGSAGAIEEITLAHELEHALAFDSLGFPLPERTRSGSGDRDLAALSLIEGDATLTMSLYSLRHIGLEDQLGLGGDPSLMSGQDDFDALPDYLRRQLLFPYEAGLQYVCERYARGGWAAVDRAYDDPPRSTAELLGLDSDLGEPVDPPPGGELAKPWRRKLRDQLGAAELAWLFAAPGGDAGSALPEPRSAIAAWGGGEVVLWERPGESALSISLVDRGGGALCGAVIAWYSAAVPDAQLSRDGTSTTFDGERDAAVVCDQGSVRVGIAPDAQLAASLTA